MKRVSKPSIRSPVRAGAARAQGGGGLPVRASGAVLATPAIFRSPDVRLRPGRVPRYTAAAETRG